LVLAIDDFDAFAFKREQAACQILRLVGIARTIRFIATCCPTAGSRFSSDGHPITAALRAVGGCLRMITIDALDERAALALIRCRAPDLSRATARAIIREAAGHPSALVFLSRIAELGGPSKSAPREIGTSNKSVTSLIERAAEFAGAVYAEPWAGLGPQQRAILWHLGVAKAPVTASAVAESLALSASHVSAQLSRLVAEGLVTRGARRGQFSVAPLLARWITDRAARSPATERAALERACKSSAAISSAYTGRGRPVRASAPVTSMRNISLTGAGRRRANKRNDEGTH
jgi:hypothetical protein